MSPRASQLSFSGIVRPFLSMCNAERRLKTPRKDSYASTVTGNGNGLHAPCPISGDFHRSNLPMQNVALLPVKPFPATRSSAIEISDRSGIRVNRTCAPLLDDNTAGRQNCLGQRRIGWSRSPVLQCILLSSLGESNGCLQCGLFFCLYFWYTTYSC